MRERPPSGGFSFGWWWGINPRMAGAVGAEAQRGYVRLTNGSAGFEIDQLETLCESVQAQA